MVALRLDPMPRLRVAFEARVEDYFNRLAAGTLQKDVEHARKRVEAARIVAGEQPAPWFVAAAEIEFLSAADLAALILAKEDETAARGNERRATILAVRGSQTPDQLDRIAEGLDPVFWSLTAPNTFHNGPDA